MNPFNRTLTPGGSSGGESALIAAKGSVLGIGTDIGGSVRIPAGYMGLYGLKGSVGRMPHAGLNGSHDGMDAIVGALGPIARSARDLSLFCRVMLQYEPWLLEPSIIEIPWKQDLADGVGIPSKLTFAILWDDGVVTPHDPILNALRRTKDALIAAGHEVIPWIPLDHQGSWDLIVRHIDLQDFAIFNKLPTRSSSISSTVVQSIGMCWSMIRLSLKPSGYWIKFRMGGAHSQWRNSSRFRWLERTFARRLRVIGISRDSARAAGNLWMRFFAPLRLH